MNLITYIIVAITSNFCCLLIKKDQKLQLVEEIFSTNHKVRDIDISNKRDEVEEEKSKSKKIEDNEIIASVLKLLPLVNIVYTEINERKINKKIISKLQNEGLLIPLNQEEKEYMAGIKNRKEKLQYISTLMNEMIIAEMVGKIKRLEQNALTLSYQSLPNKLTIDELNLLAKESSKEIRLIEIEETILGIVSDNKLINELENIKIAWDVENRIFKSNEIDGNIIGNKEIVVMPYDKDLNDDISLQQAYSKLINKTNDINANLPQGILYLKSKVPGEYSYEDILKMEKLIGSSCRLGRYNGINCAILGIPNEQYKINYLMINQDDKVQVHAYDKTQPTKLASKKYQVYTWNPSQGDTKKLKKFSLEKEKQTLLEKQEQGSFEFITKTKK